jgi:hypothetical protein
MIAHGWFAKHFGHTMNGRDFKVKCEMADEQMNGLRVANKDALIAHKWFVKNFGEGMNGLDFAAKCSIADANLRVKPTTDEAAWEEVAKLLKFGDMRDPWVLVGALRSHFGVPATDSVVPGASGRDYTPAKPITGTTYVYVPPDHVLRKTCDDCRTETHCLHHKRCLAECVPEDLKG